MRRARRSCSATHCGEVRRGVAYTWGTSTRRGGNRFGQLGRGETGDAAGGQAGPVEWNGAGGPPPRVAAVACGGTKDSGHTLLVGQDGSVYACGCVGVVAERRFECVISGVCCDRICPAIAPLAY